MKQWNNHYCSPKSSLHFPDENLVRMIMKRNMKKDSLWLDCGTGSGRHLHLLDTLGYTNNIGTDLSINGLKLADPGHKMLIAADNKALPFTDNFFHGIIAWGSLHYNPKNEFPDMLKQLHRVLKDRGSVFATLRSEFDTHLKRGRNLGNNVWQTDLNDIQGSIASFYSEQEIYKYFNHFSSVHVGLMERTLMGDLHTKISHWIIEAIK